MWLKFRANDCSLTIVLIWTGEPLHRQRTDPEQMYLQQQERPQSAALHSPDTHRHKQLGHLGFNSKHLYTKNVSSSVLLNKVWWHGAWTVCLGSPCSSASRIFSKERAGGNMKHLDAGRASLLCSHTLTFPPWGHNCRTLSLLNHEGGWLWEKNSWWLLLSLLIRVISDEREIKKAGAQEKFRCAVRGHRRLSLPRSVCSPRRIAESGLFSLSVSPHFVRGKKKNLPSQLCSVAMIPKDPLLGDQLKPGLETGGEPCCCWGSQKNVCVCTETEREGGVNTSSHVSLLWKQSQSASHCARSPHICLHSSWLSPHVVVRLLSAVFISSESFHECPPHRQQLWDVHRKHTRPFVECFFGVMKGHPCVCKWM